ncbi:Hypothetical protein PBC10988_7710 [Planctomycetales bacterium 10988]|nr:Hypothetical protein PBC10988_7710 [Planctomycetales bacterium 10988]
MLQSRQRKLLILLVRLTVFSLLGAGGTILAFYWVVMQGQQNRLLEIASGQAFLIEAMARNNIRNFTGEDVRNAEAATLTTLRNAPLRTDQDYDTTSAYIIRRNGRRLEFLQRAGEFLSFNPITHPGLSDFAVSPQDDHFRFSALSALEGESGTIIVQDEMGNSFLMAYSPVPTFNWGVIVTIPLSEIHEPFWQVGLLIAMSGLGALGCGALFLTMSSPLITRLEEVELRARDIVDHASDGILTIDTEGQILSFNAAAEQIFGYEAEEIIGENVTLLMPTNEATSHDYHISQYILTGSAKILGQTREVRGLRRDGTEFPMELNVSEIFVHSRRTFTGVVRDISRQKADEDAMRKYAQELERTNQALAESQRQVEAAMWAKSEFLANVSHELRTPINAILGMTELALTASPSPEQQEYLNTVRAAADSLLYLVSDVLDFSKIEAGKLSLEKVHFFLPDLLTEMLRTLVLAADRKGVTLLCDVSEQVPRWVRGDPGRLRQVLVNLIDNAIKFTDQGEVTLRVELSPLHPVSATSRKSSTQLVSVSGAENSPEKKKKKTGKKKSKADSEHPPVRLQFSVSDTGIGIPVKKQSAIFDAFTQADGSTTRKYGGTGLGLAIVARLIAMMKGRIWLQSVVGRGTTFYCTALLETCREGVVACSKNWKEISNQSIQERMHTIGEFSQPYSLLLINAHEPSLNLLRAMLVRKGATVSVAGNVKDALAVIRGAKLNSAPFDAIILDAQLPKMSGFRLAEELRNSEDGSQTPPMVLLAGPQHAANLVRYQRCAHTVVLFKPVIEAGQLAHAVEWAICGKAVISEEGDFIDPGMEGASVAPMNPLKVLLAEDNMINQRVAVEWLQRWGHQVLVANNGVEALEILESSEIDLVLMDVQMPMMDGLTATENWRKQENGTSRIPVIALTAHSQIEDRQRCYDAGMDDYLAKPIRPFTLKRILETYGDHQGLDGMLEVPESEITETALNDSSMDNSSSSLQLTPSTDHQATSQTKEVEPLPSSSEPRSTNGSLFDLNEALTRCGGNQQLLKEIATLLLTDAPKLLATMERGLQEENGEQAAKAAHTFKGAVSYFSAESILQETKILQTNIHEGKFEEAAAVLNRLQNLWKSLESELSHLQA